MASVSPKHDTHPLIVAAGEFSVSILAGDQIVEGQYFSYPGHKLRRVADRVPRPAGPATRPARRSCRTPSPGCAARRSSGCRWPTTSCSSPASSTSCPGRLREPPLLYSSRLGWRVTGDRAREPGVSVRDQLLARAGVDGGRGSTTTT